MVLREIIFLICRIYFLNKANEAGVTESNLLHIDTTKQYYLSGCPSGGSVNTYNMALLYSDGTSWSTLQRDAGDGQLITNFGEHLYYSIRINLQAGTVINNLTFYPMIRLASIEDATYEPYAKTNQELTEDSVDWDDMSQLGAVNFLEVTATGTTTKTGGSGSVDFTVNADKSITINCDGTHTSDVYFSCAKVTVPKGSWELSALQTNSNMTYFMYLDSVTGITYDNRYDSGNGTRFTNSAEFSTTLSICVKAGTALNNVTIYQMIAPVDYNGNYVPYAMSNRQLTKELADIYDAVTQSY